MLGLNRHSARQETGAAAVEFAIILPVLLLIIFGIIEFGFVFNSQIAITQAAREGVRVEALGTGDAVQTTKDAFLGAAGTIQDPIAVDECPNSDDKARVTAEVLHDPIVLPVSPITLTGQAVMRCGG